MIFWKKASKLDIASWTSGLELIVKQNNMIPVKSVATAIVYFLPMYLISTVYAAMIEPGTPKVNSSQHFAIPESRCIGRHVLEHQK